MAVRQVSQSQAAATPSDSGERGEISRENAGLDGAVVARS